MSKAAPKDPFPGGLVPQALYKQFVRHMPIACVDVVVINDGHYLLIRRENEPEKGEYFFPGGRIHKGESFLDAARRKVLEETGLALRSPKVLSVFSTTFSVSAFSTPTHTINTVVYGYAPSRKTRLDHLHSDTRWMPLSAAPKHPYLLSVLKLLRQELTSLGKPVSVVRKKKGPRQASFLRTAHRGTRQTR